MQMVCGFGVPMLLSSVAAAACGSALHGCIILLNSAAMNCLYHNPVLLPSRALNGPG